jgi:hypothetical protein
VRPGLCLLALAACGDNWVPERDEPDAPPARTFAVTVVAPNGGEPLVAAEPVEIRWTADDPAGRALTFEIALVDEDGTAKVIAPEAAASPLTWTPAGVRAPTPFRIRVTARASEADEVTDTSDAPFTLSPPATGTSLARDVQPIFTAHCAVQFCHGEGSQVALLALDEGAAWASLVDVASATTACNAYKRVRPGEPDASYLLWKLAGAGPCLTGVRMPKGGAPLPADDIARIRAWIAEGARNN